MKRDERALRALAGEFGQDHVFTFWGQLNAEERAALLGQLDQVDFPLMDRLARKWVLDQPAPSPPSRENWLGTDDRGRDILARLIYGFRLSMLFALALTLAGTVLGLLAGAVQGYFGGRTDLVIQRVLEVWGSMPELYLLLIMVHIRERQIMKCHYRITIHH